MLLNHKRFTLARETLEQFPINTSKRISRFEEAFRCVFSLRTPIDNKLEARLTTKPATTVWTAAVDIIN